MSIKNPKSELKIDGKMSRSGADKVGLRLANTLMIAILLFGGAAVIAAASVWFK